MPDLFSHTPLGCKPQVAPRFLPHQYLPWYTGGSWSSEAIANMKEARKWIFLSLERQSTAVLP